MWQDNVQGREGAGPKTVGYQIALALELERIDFDRDQVDDVKQCFCSLDHYENVCPLLRPFDSNKKHRLCSSKHMPQR